jgi:hypothetical protein
MRTVIGIIVAITPLLVVFGLLTWTSQRERLRRDVRAPQRALTGCDRRSLEIVLTPQPEPLASKPAAARDAMRASSGI